MSRDLNDGDKPNINNVVNLRNVTYGEVPPDKVLRGALEKLDLVMVIGYNSKCCKNELYIASSTGEVGELMLLLKRAEKKLLEDFDD